MSSSAASRVVASMTASSSSSASSSSAADRLRAGRSRFIISSTSTTLPSESFRRRRETRASSVATTMTARLRPGRQGVQRIYRMTSEKSNINVYEYLEALGVPRVNALRVQSEASEWFEYENAKRGGAADAPFGVEEMSVVVAFLESKGVSAADVGKLVNAHPATLAYSVEGRLRPLFEYLGELGLDADAVVAAVSRRPNMLGLDPNENMRKMVDYLVSNGETQEQALEYLLKTL